MNYSTLSKSALWNLVKEAKLTTVTWQSTKLQMIEALENIVVEGGNADLSTYDSEVNTETTEVNIWDDVFNEVYNNGLRTLKLKEERTDTGLLRVVPDTKVEVIKDTKPVIDESVNKDQQTVYFSWSYKDHELSGGWKSVIDASEIIDINSLIDALNLTLPNEQQILVHGKTISIKMHPGKAIKEAVNGANLIQVEKQHQKNNDYANRKRTKLSTNDSPGKHSGETSVKASILFKAAKLIPARYFINGAANIDGIDTISINSRQVYPFSISAGN